MNKSYIEELLINIEVFDYDALLERVIDDVELVKNLIKIFIDDTRRHVLQIKDLIVKNEYSSLKEVFHQIKGSSANMSANRINKLSIELEEASLDSDMSRIKIIFEYFVNELDKFEHYSLKYL